MTPRTKRKPPVCKKRKSHIQRWKAGEISSPNSEPYIRHLEDQVDTHAGELLRDQHRLSRKIREAKQEGFTEGVQKMILAGNCPPAVKKALIPIIRKRLAVGMVHALKTDRVWIKKALGGNLTALIHLARQENKLDDLLRPQDPKPIKSPYPGWRPPSPDPADVIPENLTAEDTLKALQELSLTRS